MGPAKSLCFYNVVSEGMGKIENMNILKLNNESNKIRTIATWFFKEWGTSTSSVEKYISFISSSLKDDELPIFFIAEETNLVGTAHLARVDMGGVHPELTPWLAGVFVDSAHRGKGLGEALSLAVLKKAKELGFEFCYLYTDSKEDWYSKSGWLVVSREIYKNKNVVIMKFNL